MPAILYDGRQYKKAHHSKVLTEKQTHQQHQLQDQDEQHTIVHNADVLHDDDDCITIDPIADGGVVPGDIWCDCVIEECKWRQEVYEVSETNLSVIALRYFVQTLQHFNSARKVNRRTSPYRRCHYTK